MELYWIVMATLLFSRTNRCESATLTINPPSMSISGSNTGSMTVKCSPPDGTGALVALNIFRILISTPQETEIATASFVSNNGDAQMVTPIAGASVSGSLTERSITVTMTQVSCNDAGMYRCKASYFVQGSVTKVVETTEDKNFTVQALPGPVTLIAMPHFTSYELNATLEMTCNGQVGSTTSGTQITWVWEYQDYPGFTWNPYMPESDIVPPSPSLPENRCQNNQISLLTRRLALEDERRTYRCYVRRNGQTFVEFAGTYMIGAVCGTANPGPITVTANPASSIYEYGTRLVLTCNGFVGSGEVQWVWEYKEKHDIMWSSYIPPSVNDVSTNQSTPINNCQKIQVSSLSLFIRTEDNGRRYRCYVRRGTYNFDQYAAEYLIGSVISPDTSNFNDFSRGLALGIGCTLAFVIVIIVVALVWMWRSEWVLPCARSDKPEQSVRTVSKMVNCGPTEESQISQERGNNGIYDELKTYEIGQAAPYSKMAV